MGVKLYMEKNFNNKNFAELYMKKHRKLLEKLGYVYAKKLNGPGFSGGRIIDVGCGFGSMCAVIA